MKFPIVTVAMVSVALVYVFWGQTQESSERIRTSDLCLRRAALYPAELRARMGRNIATWMRIAKHRLPLHVQKIISGLLRSQIKVLRMA